MVGEMLGQFELRGELGRGAMAVVWRAWDTKLDREVAIKEPMVAPGTDAATATELAERFVREGKAAAQLNHPGIVTIYAADVYDDRPAIVMELIEGATLSEVLAAGRMDPQAANGILEQLLDAAGYAHSRGIVHRDIKPDNVFVTHDGRVKLADFGIAHVGTTSTLTQAGAVMGTPGYMAPEQVTGDPVDARTDIFAIGVIGYELFAGRNPFGVGDHGTQPTTIMYRIVHEQPSPIPEAAFAGLQIDLRPAIQQAMSKDPGARFPDAAAFRAALQGGPLPRSGDPAAPYPGLGIAAASQLHAGGASSATEVIVPHVAKPRPNWLPYAAVAAIGAIAIAVLVIVAVSGGPEKQSAQSGAAVATATAPAAAPAVAGAFEVTLKARPSVTVGEQVTIEAEVSNPAAVKVVKFYLRGQYMGEATSEPYVYTFNAQAGEYAFQAKATGVDGTVKSSATMAVTAAAPAPTPQPTASASSSNDDIDMLLSAWTQTVEREDELGHLACYADVVSPFFGKSSASNDQVRTTKRAFFGKTHSMVKISVSDVALEMQGPDDATATLTKSWNYGSGPKSVRQRLWFTRTGDGWKISGEKDL